MKPAIIACLCIATVAAAQDSSPKQTVPPATNTVATLPELTVSSTRLPDQQELATKLPANVTVITGDQIKQSSATSVPEMLAQQAGIQNIDTIGFGLDARPNMRGFGERSGALVLVDGVRVNDAGDSTHNALWPSIPAGDIERIEIIRGGGSQIYGEGAIGGVINIITKHDAITKPYLNTDFSAGNFGYWQSHVDGGAPMGPGRFSASATYNEGDGPRDGSAFWNETVQSNIGLTNSLGNFNAGVYYHRDRLRNPDVLSYAQYHDDSEQIGNKGPTLFENELMRLTFDWQKSFDSGFSFHIKPFLQEYTDRLQTTPQNYGGGVGDTEQPNWGTTLQLSHVTDVLGGKNTATIGAEFIRQNYNSVFTGPMFGTSKAYIDYDTTSFFAQDALDVTERLRLQAGVRFDTRHYNIYQQSLPFEGSRSVDAWSPGGGAVYSFTKTESCYFNISRSFKLPVGFDIGTYTPEYMPNVEIKPTEATNYEIGYRWNRWKEFSGSIALYHSDVQDDIQLNPVAVPFAQNQNFNETRNGIELSLQSAPLDWLELYFNYTLQQSQFAGGIYDGNQIPQVPEHMITGGLAWTPVKWFRWSWNVTYARDQVPTNDLSNQFERNQYVVLNAKMSVIPCKFAEVYLSINNALDAKYETFPTSNLGSPQVRFYNPAPGLGVIGGVRMQF